MSTTPIELEIQARQRDLGGGFTVRRLLPAPQRRMVGPFIFFDHMGPVTLPSGEGLDVRPHPHIGLATVTYLFEGEFLHRDSLGSEQIIRPGAVNWMTAGRGIVHSERSPVAARKTGPSIHGLQLWVALPDEAEEAEPSFRHHGEDTIPQLEQGGARLRVVAGSAFGVRSPVAVLSPLFYVDATLDADSSLRLPDEFAERGIYVLSGALEVDGSVYRSGAMLAFRSGAPVTLLCREPARAMLFGGAPLGQRYIDWNFVSSSPDRIKLARKDWLERAFPIIPGDSVEFIPLPPDPLS